MSQSEKVPKLGRGANLSRLQVSGSSGAIAKRITASHALLLGTLVVADAISCISEKGESVGRSVAAMIPEGLGESGNNLANFVHWKNDSDGTIVYTRLYSGFLQQDILCQTTKDGGAKWSTPGETSGKPIDDKALSIKVNTSWDEASPVLKKESDGTSTLYFTSERGVTEELFMSKLFDMENCRATTNPINLGVKARYVAVDPADGKMYITVPFSGSTQKLYVFDPDTKTTTLMKGLAALTMEGLSAFSKGGTKYLASVIYSDFPCKGTNTNQCLLTVNSDGLTISSRKSFEKIAGLEDVFTKCFEGYANVDLVKNQLWLSVDLPVGDAGDCGYANINTFKLPVGFPSSTAPEPTIDAGDADATTDADASDTAETGGDVAKDTTTGDTTDSDAVITDTAEDTPPKSDADADGITDVPDTEKPDTEKPDTKKPDAPITEIETAPNCAGTPFADLSKNPSIKITTCTATNMEGVLAPGIFNIGSKTVTVGARHGTAPITMNVRWPNIIQLDGAEEYRIREPKTDLLKYVTLQYGFVLGAEDSEVRVFVVKYNEDGTPKIIGVNAVEGTHRVYRGGSLCSPLFSGGLTGCNKITKIEAGATKYTLFGTDQFNSDPDGLAGPPSQEQPQGCLACNVGYTKDGTSSGWLSVLIMTAVLARRQRDKYHQKAA